MAGIQLTGADMSGAMPNATVEALNVPVFIDEYLQQSMSTTSTTTAATSTNYSQTCSNSSIDNSNNNFNNGSYDLLGEDLKVYNNKRFEDFDFDMDLIDINYNNNDLVGKLPDEDEMTNFSEGFLNGMDFNDIPEPPLLSLVDDQLHSNPMLSDAAVLTNSQVNSQNFIANAKPIVPEEMCFDEMESEYFSPMISMQSDMEQATCMGSTRLAEKRHKLRLNTFNQNVSQDINTPNILLNVSELQDKMNFDILPVESIAMIEQSLIDCISNSSRLDSSCDAQPYTPQSYTTTDFNTSPSSPALSTTSTIAIANRKKRGRPMKEHSDQPDPAELNKLSEAERKRRCDRAKNNEASRVSRRKNKMREEQEKEMEKELMERNRILLAEKHDIEKQLKKLKRALKRQIANPQSS